jgi:hypothetical protein
MKLEGSCSPSPELGVREHLSDPWLELFRSRFSRIGNTTQDHRIIRDVVDPDGLVVFYLNRRVDGYNDEIAHIEAMQRNEAMVTIKRSFFIESAEHFRANEERPGDLPRWLSMGPATWGQIDGFSLPGDSATFQQEFHTR